MHVVILARGLSVPVGGTRTYLERLIPALPNADPSIHYTVLHNSAAHQDHFPDCEQQYIPGNSAFLWEQRVFPKALGALHPDVVFCPKNLIPFGVSQKWPTVITLHDLLYYPVTQPPLREYHWYDVAYIRSFLPRSVRQAKSIVAVSEHTKRDAIKLFNINPSKIVVAHHGVEVPCETEVNSDAQHVARATFGLDKPFLFYSGSLSPRKNMARVVEAFARIAETIPHQLVVTAGKSWKDRAVFEAVKRCGLQSRFMQLGHVSPAQLNALYAAADVYLYPSLFEGFGMPGAGSHGCGLSGDLFR